MEKALANLKDTAETADTQQTISLLDTLIVEADNLSAEELTQYTIDPIIKKLLKTQPSIELLEKIGDLLFLIRDPRNFHAELVETATTESLTLPMLMLIFQIRQEFVFPYEQFYSQLLNLISVKTLKSEGFLFFLLRCFENKDIDFATVADLLRRLSTFSVVVPSQVCIRIVYTMLVIMRIHPAAFRLVPELNELSLLSASFDSIKKIVHRIFIEAEHPSERPKAIFLQNFTFPDF